MTLTITDENTIERHRRKCQVCRHPHLEAIESAYTQWESVKKLSQEHAIDERALFRHIKAIGLDDRRQLNIEQLTAKARELAPWALEQLYKLANGATKEETRLKALDSLLDRAGVVRMSKTQSEASIEMKLPTKEEREAKFAHVLKIVNQRGLRDQES